VEAAPRAPGGCVSAGWLAALKLVGGWRALPAWCLALALGITALIATHQRDSARTELTRHLSADTAAELARQARAAAEAQQHAAAVAAIEQDFEDRRVERETEVEQLLADARAGALRLRPRFACPGVPAAAGAAPGADDAAHRGLRPDDAEFLVRLAARCNAVAAERELGRRYAEALRIHL